MSRDNCILTTKDFTILEIMLDRVSDRDEQMRQMLREKLNSAIVMFREDVPPDVATLSSRVRFRIDEGEAETRVLSHAPMGSPVGMFLPITAPRGLALLGLREQERFRLERAGGGTEELLLEKVLYQPEAERSDWATWTEATTPEARRARLKVVGGSRVRAVPPAMRVPQGGAGGDDPGPSAA